MNAQGVDERMINVHYYYYYSNRRHESCRHSVGTALYGHLKLQALVYDILPPTTAIVDYAIGLGKLSANEQFFVGAQTVVILLQTTTLTHTFKKKAFQLPTVCQCTRNSLN